MNNKTTAAHHDVGHSTNNKNCDQDKPEPQAKRCRRNSTASLHTINDDCLREIFNYLNVFEVGNVASTCTRLQKFAETLYPKIARDIVIAFQPLDSIEYQKQFESFGNFVQKLIVDGKYSNQQHQLSTSYNMKPLDVFEKLLSLCPNLHTLRMYNFKFGSDDSQIMRHVARCLKVLTLENCTGIENDWSEALKPLTKIEHISIIGTNNITANFFKHNTNLSDLTIHNGSLATENELVNIFEQNGQKIRMLKLIKFAESSIFQSIGILLANKLPNLDSLAIDDYACDKLTDSLTELPHLKFLKLNCYFESVNSVMRRISERATIENLIIIDGVFVAEADDAPPLVFNQLKSFRWNMRMHKRFDTAPMLKALTKSQMPAIQIFNFDFHVESMNGLLTLLESKKTVQWLHINFYRWSHQKQRTFLNKLMLILRDDMSRPNLNMTTVRLMTFKHDMELEVSKIIK